MGQINLLHYKSLSALFTRELNKLRLMKLLMVSISDSGVEGLNTVAALHVDSLKFFLLFVMASLPSLCLHQSLSWEIFGNSE